jgi:hypothetical protein
MLRRHISLPLAVSTVAALIAASVGVPATAALFTSQYPVTAGVVTGHVFPGERDVVPFTVSDHSSGSALDVSNPYAFAGDGLTTATATWSASFASDRYLEFKFNAPLPAAVGIASASFAFRFASATPASTACFYFELRRESTGDPVETHGGAGSPVACVTGTTLTTTTTTLTSLADTTTADDLRVRVYANDSAGGAITIDAATVSGDYGLATFTLYPVEVRDLADTTPDITRWGPAGP